MTTWSNWAGTVRADVDVATPGTVGELQKVVAAAAAQRAPGEAGGGRALVHRGRRH